MAFSHKKTATIRRTSEDFLPVTPTRNQTARGFYEQVCRMDASKYILTQA